MVGTRHCSAFAHCLNTGDFLSGSGLLRSELFYCIYLCREYEVVLGEAADFGDSFLLVCYTVFMALVTPKMHPARQGAKMEIRRNVKAWRALSGIWKRKKLIDPVRWQRRIRRESAR